MSSVKTNFADDILRVRQIPNKHKVIVSVGIKRIKESDYSHAANR